MVKVYLANVNALREEEAFASNLQYVCSERKDKVLRCKQREDQLRSLAAGLLLRHAIEREGIVYETVKTSYNSHGKLMLEIPGRTLWVSISHSGDFAAVAISDRKVGLDLQQDRTMRSEDRMRELCFTEEEKKREEPFIYTWTRKESYAKMLGLGLQIDLRELDTTKSEMFSTSRIEGDYWISICTEEKEEDILYTTVAI